MIGCIIGDIVGSRFEGMSRYPKTKNFKLFHKTTRFTDDTILSVATADALLFNIPYNDIYRQYYVRYPHGGYGKAFKEWANSANPQPYNSWGNGSAMRVSPVGWAFNTESEILENAKKSAEVTHNHIEGIKGAQSVAYAIFMLRNKASKNDVESVISKIFDYDLHPAIKDEWDVSCQGCVPQAFASFLDSTSFEGCIRKAIFRGGDSDTIAAIACSIAEAYYGVPDYMVAEVFNTLSDEIGNVVELFVKTYVNKDFVRPHAELPKWEKLFNVFS